MGMRVIRVLNTENKLKTKQKSKHMYTELINQKAHEADLFI